MNKLAWPQQLPQPQHLSEIKQTLERLENEVAQLLEQQSKAQELLRQSIQNAQEALAQGQLKRATQHLAQARKQQKLGYRSHDKAIAQLSVE